MSARPGAGFLLALLDQAYDHASWHGTNLRGSIRRVSAAQAAWRPTPRRHNIWELVVHAAYWKYAAWRRLSGEPRRSFPVRGSNWFPRPADVIASPGRPGSSRARESLALERAWRADIALLDRMHRALRERVATLSSRALSATPHGSKVSNLSLLAGVAAHDLYHAGQIQLLKRLSIDATSR